MWSRGYDKVIRKGGAYEGHVVLPAFRKEVNREPNAAYLPRGRSLADCDPDAFRPSPQPPPGGQIQRFYRCDLCLRTALTRNRLYEYNSEIRMESESSPRKTPTRTFKSPR